MSVGHHTSRRLSKRPQLDGRVRRGRENPSSVVRHEDRADIVGVAGEFGYSSLGCCARVPDSNDFFGRARDEDGPGRWSCERVDRMGRRVLEDCCHPKE